MSLEIDLRNAITNRADNFTCKLMQLMMKADVYNFEKLESVYPKEATLVRAYKLGLTLGAERITNPKNGIDVLA